MKKAKAREALAALVDKYDSLSDQYKRGLNEANTRKDFILPMFRALGWNTDDSQEVSEEVRVGQMWVDYAFKIDGVTRFYLEAKAAGGDLEKPKYAVQAVSYAYNKGIPWAVLTNFEQLKLFSAEWNLADVNRLRVLDLRYNEYLEDEAFDDLWALACQNVAKDGIRKQFERRGGAVRRAQAVDERLFDLFKQWRLSLIEMFVHYLPDDSTLRMAHIDEAVQRILDRLVFIRTVEDRKIEDPKLWPIYVRRNGARAKGADGWTSLRELFREMDEVYDSNLFRRHLADELRGDETRFLPILRELYSPSGVAFRFDFSAIEADVLGRVYEQYLGHVAQTIKSEVKRGDQFYMPGLEPANAQSLELVSRQAKRKQQGIYYTPKYVVDYIVDQTLGRLLEERGSDAEFVEQLRVLDPACGSGSFLIAAYERLLAFYAEVRQLQGPEQLEQDERVAILLRHIYGVDLDPQAVEIARLNLILRAVKEPQLLPELDDNIVMGNSLISGDEGALAGYFGENWREMHPLNWEERFPAIMARGGFEVVIGNPPYVDIKTLSPDYVDYLFAKYETANNRINLFSAFVEQGLKLTGSHFSMIVPSALLAQVSYAALRQFITNNYHIASIVRLPNESFGNTAGEVKVDTTIVVIDTLEETETNIIAYEGFERISSITAAEADISHKALQSDWAQHKDYVWTIGITDVDKRILEKCEANSAAFEECGEFCLGITPYDKYKGHTPEQIKQRVFHAYEKKDTTYKKLLAGNDVKRYFVEWNGEDWISYGPWLGAPREDRFFKQERIIVKQIIDWTSKRIWATLTDEELYNTQNAFTILARDGWCLEYLLGILNSRLLTYYHRKKFLDELKMRFQKILIRDCRRFPIHRIDPTKSAEINLQNQIVENVNTLIDLQKTVNNLPDTEERREVEQQIAETDRALDELVYQLYGLTDEEIAVVEGGG